VAQPHRWCAFCFSRRQIGCHTLVGPRWPFRHPESRSGGMRDLT
jgi:hypothetical protein